MPNSDHSCLVEDMLGRQWYFTLSDRQVIVYTRRENDNWSYPLEINENPVKRFRVTIDQDDKLHILAYDSLRQLVYYEWNGNIWLDHLLHRVQSRFENIAFIEILYTAGKIHIFYFIESSLQRSHEYLIHTLIENDKLQNNVVMTFLSDQRVKIQLVQNDTDGNVFIIYTKIIYNDTHCYCIYHDYKSSSWSKPVLLFRINGECSNFDGYADSNGNLNIIWLEKNNLEYRLNYIKLNKTYIQDNYTIYVIDSKALPIQKLCIHLDDFMYCFWQQDKIIWFSQSNINSIQWSEAQELFNGSVDIYRRIIRTLNGDSRFYNEIGEGYPNFSWTVKSLIKERNDKVEDKSKQNKGWSNEKKDKGIIQELDEIYRKFEFFQNRIKEIDEKIDNLYSALYQLQDYIRQSEKNSFERNAQIQKLAFELEQLRALKDKGNSTDYDKNISNIKKDTIKPLPNNVDLGNGEILLGNVSILINPDEDQDGE